MRRIAPILLGLVGCLLLMAGGLSRATHAVLPTTADRVAAVVDDRSPAEQWLCERVCNSDLGVPRAGGEVMVRLAPAVTPRCGCSDYGRTAWRTTADLRAVQTLKETSSYESNLSAGLYAVDYYVYRLRRLII